MITNVLQYLEATAARTPDSVAFYDEKQNITFARLMRRARDLGSRIRSEADSAGRPVAVLVRRDVDSLIGMFAALYAGSFYAPLDVAMPEARLRSVLERLCPAAIVFVGGDESVARNVASDIPRFDAAEECPPCDGDGTAKVFSHTVDLDPAYVIFTSGSTGVPKGIAVSHRSVIDFTEWYAGTTGVTKEDRIGNQAPFFFDLSVKDIYLTLKTGAPTYLIPKKCFSFPVLLIRALNDERITTLSWATAAFNMAANSGVFEKYRPEYLKRVLLGGEALRAKQLNAWRRAAPDAEYFNLYGPTETTVDCTYFPIRDGYGDEDPIPIGIPCENMDVFLLGEDDRKAPVGVPGEICARGTGVAIGYYGDPERTAGSFTQNPLSGEIPDRIFRTGDIGVLGEDGYLYYIGRRDNQIKHSGYRIELGEIEAAMTAADGVHDAACVFDAEGDRITGLYTGSADEASVTGALRAGVPKYMIPERIVRIDSMPRLPNGKLDRGKLREEWAKW